MNKGASIYYVNFVEGRGGGSSRKKHQYFFDVIYGCSPPTITERNSIRTLRRENHRNRWITSEILREQISEIIRTFREQETQRYLFLSSLRRYRPSLKTTRST